MRIFCVTFVLVMSVCSAIAQTTQSSVTASVPEHFETVVVNANADSLHSDSSGEFSLAGADLENLATVLADDPLRALQALPGVTSNDDFGAQFSLRGADFSRIGIYLDGVELHNAIHSLEGTDLSGSSSVFNPAVLGGLDLYEDVYSERFADSTAGAMDVHLRDGNSDRYSFRLMMSLSSAGAMAEGPLGRVDRCSWITGFRKSYLQYLLTGELAEPSMVFGVQDTQGRLNCRVSAHQNIAVDVIDSDTDLNRRSMQASLGANALMLADQHFRFVNAGWTLAPSSNFLVQNHVAWTEDSFDAQNPVSSPLGNGNYHEETWSSEATRMWNSLDGLSAGFTVRDMADRGFSEEYDTVRGLEHLDEYDGRGLLANAFVQETWSFLRGRVRLTAGGSWHHHWTDRVTAWTPQGSVSYRATSSTIFEAGWAQYVQYPEISVFDSNLGSAHLLPMRTNLATASMEQRLGSKTLARVVFYNRLDRDMIYQPWADPRLIDGLVFIPPVNALFTNALHGYARGTEFRLQRSSNHGVSGWVSYAYGRTEDHDGVTGDSFPSDWDQRHTVNAYTTYRLRPSVNVSARWTYGSGFPVPGYLTGNDAGFYLSDQRNTDRLAPYQRLDLRVNKTWARERTRINLYGEVLNVTNKVNERFGSLDGYEQGLPHAAWVSVDSMFPVLPAVGLVIEH